jgi:hypothetical protein
VVLEDDVSPKPVRDALRELGCPSELYGQLGIVVIDVPSSVDYSPVREILDRGERDGEWEFHEPALRHADPDDG